MAKKIDFLWRSRPWIGARVIGSTIAIVIVVVVLTWAELSLGVASTPLLGVDLIFWTYAGLLLVLLLMMLGALIMRASNLYTLRETSLEVEMGIGNKRTIVISAGGFADLEVIRTIEGRILSVGDIIIRSEGAKEVRLRRVRHPVEVSNLIRDVMTRPVVRVAREPTVEPP